MSHHNTDQLFISILCLARWISRVIMARRGAAADVCDVDGYVHRAADSFRAEQRDDSCEGIVQTQWVRPNWNWRKLGVPVFASTETNRLPARPPGMASAGPFTEQTRSQSAVLWHVSKQCSTYTTDNETGRTSRFLFVLYCFTLLNVCWILPGNHSKNTKKKATRRWLTGTIKQLGCNWMNLLFVNSGAGTNKNVQSCRSKIGHVVSTWKCVNSREAMEISHRG